MTYHVDRFVQTRSNSSALAMELLQSGSKSSMYYPYETAHMR